MNILNPVGVAKAGVEGNFTIYNWIGKDIEGNDFVMTFALQSIYTESFEKYLHRLIPIKIEKETEPNDNEATKH